MATATAKKYEAKYGSFYIERPEKRPAAGRRNRTQSHRVLFLATVFSCFVFLAAGLLLVSVYASISELEKERGLVLQKIEKEQETLQKRKADFALLSRPERIRKIAIEKLGLVEATQVAFIEIDTSLKDKNKLMILSKSSPLLPSIPSGSGFEVRR